MPPVPLQERDRNGYTLSPTLKSTESPDKQFEWVAEEAAPNPSSELCSGVHMQELHFVSETGVSRPQGPFRDLIRSKARKRTRQKSSPVSPIEIENSRQIRGKSKFVYSQRDQDSKTAIFDATKDGALTKSGLGIRTLDPFHTIFGDSGHEQYYIHLYLNFFRHTYPHATPGSMKKKETVLRLAVEEPALMHATISHSAVGFTTFRGEPSCHDQFYHKGEAIRLVNERIGAIIKKEKASDGIIAAITTLMHFEIRSRSQPCIRGHMNGLEILVNSRGGLETMRHEGEAGKVVCWFVAWTDLCAAISLNEPLRFKQLVESEKISLEPLPPYNDFTNRLETTLIDFTGLHSLAQKATDCYWGLKNLIPLPPDEAMVLIHHGQAVQFLEYKTRLDTLERRAIMISQSRSKNAKTNRGMIIFRLFGSATLIHTLLLLRDSPCSVPLCYVISGRMKDILEADSKDIERLKMIFPEMMLWILLMAGFGSVGTGHEGMFAKSIASQVTILSHGKEDEDEGEVDVPVEVEKLLRRFIWFDGYKGPDMKAFWDQVGVVVRRRDGEIRRDEGFK